MSTKTTPRISEAEREVMSVLWEKSPLSTPEIVSQLSAARDWAPRTIRTLLARLVRKGALALDTRERPHRFRPRIARETSLARESRSFLDRVFGGEPASMLISLVRETDLTPEQIRELKKILAEKEQ